MLTFAKRADNQAIIGIADLAAMAKEQRPVCLCVACDHQLVPTLGLRNQHHFRHSAHPTCYAAEGEGALHLDAKLRLQVHLRDMAARSQPLLVRPRCARCAKEQAPVPFLALLPTDVVRMEAKWNEYRPDLLVEREERPFAMLEVFAHHLCGQKKWEDVKARGLPALEIEAVTITEGRKSRPRPRTGSNVRNVPVLPGAAGPWGPSEPLAWINQAGLPETVCSDCVKAEQARREADERAERWRQEQMLKDQDLVRARLRREFEAAEEAAWLEYATPTRVAVGRCDVDCHFADGQRFRDSFVLSRTRLRGEWVEGRLVHMRYRGMQVPVEQYDRASGLLGGRKALVEQGLKAIKRMMERCRPNVALAEAPILHGCLDGLAPWVNPTTKGEYTEEQALKFESQMPRLWWHETTQRWIRAYSRLDVAQMLQISERGVVALERKGRLRPVAVRALRGGQELIRIEAPSADGFIKWWRSGARRQGAVPF